MKTIFVIFAIIWCNQLPKSSTFEFKDLMTSVYDMWTNQKVDETINGKEVFEKFKRLVDQTTEHAQKGMKEIHGFDEHRIAKREVHHPIVRDNLGIEILVGLREILATGGVYIASDIVFCGGQLIYGLQEAVTDNVTLHSDVNGIIFWQTALPGTNNLKLLCIDDEAVLLVVGSESSMYSFAARICITCDDDPYVQTINPENVYAVDKLYVKDSAPIFGFCSGSTTSIITWKRQYFHSPLVIHTRNCVNLEFVQIHSTDYLIIAEDGNLEIYQIEPMRYRHVQSMVVSNATYIESFSIGRGISTSFYLIVVNHDEDDPQKTKPVISKWHGDAYLPQQCLDVVQVTSVSAISVDRKVIIAVLSEVQGTVFFQFNGFKFVETFQYSMSVFALPVSVSFAYSPNSTVYLLGRDGNAVAGFEAEFFVKNELAEFHDHALEKCQELKDRVTSVDVKELVNQVNSSIFIDQDEPIVINGSVTFENIRVEDTLTTEVFTVRSENRTYSHNILRALQFLADRLNETKAKLETVKDLLDRALKTSGNQTVNATYTFWNVTFDCVDCHVNTINVDTLNGVDVSNYSNLVVYTDVNETVADLTFTHGLTIRDLIITNWLNGLLVSDFVLKFGAHVITAKKTFIGDVYIDADLRVNGSVDGLVISADNLLLTHGDQNVTGHLTFAANITVASLHVTNTLDGIDIDYYYDHTVTIDGHHNISGKPIFCGDLHLLQDLDVTRGRLVDGVDIFNLNDNAFRIDRNQTITGKYYFDDVTFESGIVGNFTINGLRFPDDVVYVHETVTITNNITFHSSFSAEDLTVTGSINGLGIVEDPDFPMQLDVLVRSQEQTITGKKIYLNDIHISNDSIVTGLIDEVDLSELSNATMSVNNSQTIEGDFIVNGTVIFTDSVIVDGLVDGVNLTDFHDHAIWLNTTVLPDFNKLIFQDDVYAASVHCVNINGINTKEDFLFKNKSQMVFGAKNFSSISIEGDSKVHGLINNVNLSEFFNDVLFTDGNVTVTANKTFLNDLYVDNIVVNGTVDGKNVPDDLVPLNWTGIITITSKKTFIRIRIIRLYVRFIISFGLVDGVNIEELVNDTLTYNGSQVVTGTKNLKAGLTIVDGAEVTVNSINGLNITEIYLDAVLIYENQTIHGNKTFHNKVTFDKVNFTGSFDHVTDFEFRENWLLQGQNQTIFANLVFEYSVTFNQNVHVDGLINGINLTDLYRSAVKIDEDCVIQGPVFIDHAVSLGDVNVSGTVNGLDFSEDVVQKHKNYTKITGRKTFNDVIFHQDLNVPVVDGVDIDYFCSTALLNHGNQTITGTITVNGNVILEEDLIVGGLIDDVNLTTLSETSVRVGGSNIIETTMNFTNLIIEAPVSLNGTINGINLYDFYLNYLSLTKDQNVTGKYTFVEPVTFSGHLEVDSIVTKDNSVNGVDVVHLNNSVFKDVEDQVVGGWYTFENTVHFKGGLYVDGKVNGLNIPDDLVIVGRNNTIFGQKTFKNLTIVEDLDVAVNITVQAVDVSEWYDTAVFTSTAPNGTIYFYINGIKIFTGGLILGDISVAKLNNLTISNETILLKTGKQVITGVKTVSTDVWMANITVNHINGIDINLLDEQAVKTNKFNNITGSWTFVTNQTFHNIETKQFIDDVNVTELFSMLNQTFDLSNITDQFDKRHDVIKYLEKVVLNQAVTLNYYYKLFTLPDAAGFVSLYPLVYVLSRDNLTSCNVLYDIDNSSSIIEYHNIIAFDHTATDYGDPFAAIAVDKIDGQCPGVEYGVGPPVFNGTGNVIQVLHTDQNGDVALFQQFQVDGSVYQLSIFIHGGEVCIAVFSGTAYSIYCMDDLTPPYLLTSTHVYGVIGKIDFISSNGLIYGVISTISKHTYLTEVYVFDPVTNSTRRMTEGRYPVASNHLVTFQDKLFLVIAKKTVNHGFGAIITYKIDTNTTLGKFQVIYKSKETFIDPVDVASVKIFDQEMYLVVLSQQKLRGNVKIFKYEGAEGFKHHSDVTAKSGTQLTVMGRLLGVLTSPTCGKDPTVFRSNIRGSRPYEKYQALIKP